MKIISPAQAVKQGISANSLHAVADWNFDAYNEAEKFKDKNSSKFLMQGIALRALADAIEKHA